MSGGVPFQPDARLILLLRILQTVDAAAGDEADENHGHPLSVRQIAEACVSYEDGDEGAECCYECCVDRFQALGCCFQLKSPP